MPPLSSLYLQSLGLSQPKRPGVAQHELERAIDRLSPLDMERAIREGATLHRPDAQGRSPLNRLLDEAQNNPYHANDLRRLIACVQVAFAQGASVIDRHPRTKETALYQAARWAGHPMATVWWRLWQPRGHWQAAGNPEGKSALEAWRAQASPELLTHLPSPSLSTPARRRGP